MKRIVLCADGTWSRPEEDLSKDMPTNVLKVSRAIAPVAEDGVEQVVFYDWGVGTDREEITGGAFGHGINKNIRDCYRFLVQNYNPGDKVYLFGFSRGAYTVRSLAGLIYNCGVLRRTHGKRIVSAFELYKNRKEHPDGDRSVAFRKRYAHAGSQTVRFIGVWDTVGALGIPFRMFGFLNEKHLFHDQKIGRSIEVARHALSVDELRDDFAPTIWTHRGSIDLKQVWFSGVHSDVGGGYLPDTDGTCLSDIPLQWMIREAGGCGLTLESHLVNKLQPSPLASQHQEYRDFFKVLGKHVRRIPRHTYIHRSVKERYQVDSSYRPESLVRYLKRYSWDKVVD